MQWYTNSNFFLHIHPPSFLRSDCHKKSFCKESKHYHNNIIQQEVSKMLMITDVFKNKNTFYEPLIAYLI